MACEAEKLFQESTGCPVAVLNDADAAGYAEMRFGAGQGRGVVLIVTLGTGIGTALFSMGISSQHRVGAYRNPWQGCGGARLPAPARKDWSWKKWARRVDEYLKHMNAYLWPDLIIIGAESAKGRQILAALDCRD